jgi:hypothetical protein
MAGAMGVMPPAAWIPVRVHTRPAGPGGRGTGRPGLVVDWAHLGGVCFDDTFFEQTVERALRHPFRLLVRRETPAEALAGLDGSAPPPAGFVHHLSRCGSTLVSRALGAVPGVLALSEPGPLDTVLRAPAAELGWSDDDHARVLRGMVAALSRAAGPSGRQVVVKTDAWAVTRLPLLARAFPTVPWAYLHRDPVEVLVSHAGHRGYHTVPGMLPPDLLGIDGGDGPPADADGYTAWVLGRLATLAAAAVDERALVVDHAELPGAIEERIAPHFGIALGPAGRDAVRLAATRDAKNPVLDFVDDGADKRRRATPAIHEAADRWLRPALDRLSCAGAAT